MTNLLICGDWHGNAEQARSIIDIASFQGIEKIFQLGDFGQWEHVDSEFQDDVEAYAARKGVTIYFVDGNHDNTALTLSMYDKHDAEGFLMVRERIRYAPRGHRWTWNGTKFLALGGAVSVDKRSRLEREEREKTGPGYYWFPEEQWSWPEWEAWQDENYDVETDVIFAHDKPFNSEPPWNRKAYVECIPNAKALQTAIEWTGAKHFFHGHLHYRYTDLVGAGYNFHTGEPEIWCRVEGLDSDFNTCEGKPEDHWMIVKIEDLRDREVPHA